MSIAGLRSRPTDGTGLPPGLAADASVERVRVGPLRFALAHRAEGPWFVVDVAGRRGGVFASEAAARKFMREEAEEILPAAPATALRRVG